MPRQDKLWMRLIPTYQSTFWIVLSLIAAVIVAVWLVAA